MGTDPVDRPERSSEGARRPPGLAGLLGLRRGPVEPPETRGGQPLHPLTIPNLVGFARIGMIVAFLAIALESEDGRVALATVLWAIAAFSDYLDGLLARATGQYSRLGALLDPFVDRLLILSGVLVDWKFELLPRPALAVLAARELVMIMLVLGALRLGLELEVNWIGRVAVWPLMMGVGGVLILDHWLLDALFYAGLAGTLAASALYVRHGIRELKLRRSDPREGSFEHVD